MYFFFPLAQPVSQLQQSFPKKNETTQALEQEGCTGTSISTNFTIQFSSICSQASTSKKNFNYNRTQENEKIYTNTQACQESCVRKDFYLFYKILIV